MKFFVHSKILTFFILNVYFICEASGQSNQNGTQSDTCIEVNDTWLARNYYSFTDVMPQYIGGEDSMFVALQRNILWPQHCYGKGKILIAFIVEPDSSVSNIRVLKGLEGSDKNQCDFNKISIDAVKRLRNWIPGSCKGVRVPVQKVLPIMYNYLQE